MKRILEMRRRMRPVEGSHEIWHICLSCGFEFDRRMHGDDCPDCGTNINAIP